MADSSLVSALCALTAAALFAVGILQIKKGLQYTDAFTGTLISIGTSTAAYWLLSPFFLKSWYWGSHAVLIFAAIGLFRPLLSANLATIGTHRLGPTISATLASTSPFFAVAGGALLLAEPLSVAVVAGTLSIVAGVVVLSWRGSAPRAWSAWALLLPVAAAFLRAMGAILGKAGLDELPSPLFSGMITYTVSFLLALGIGWWRNGGLPVRTNGQGLKWFVLSGLSNGTAILSLNTALYLGHVVTVSPITASSPLFTLLFSAAIVRQERITGRMLAGVLLIVPGVVLITLLR